MILLHLLWQVGKESVADGVTGTEGKETVAGTVTDGLKDKATVWCYDRWLRERTGNIDRWNRKARTIYDRWRLETVI